MELGQLDGVTRSQKLLTHLRIDPWYPLAILFLFLVTFLILNLKTSRKEQKKRTDRFVPKK